MKHFPIERDWLASRSWGVFDELFEYRQVKKYIADQAEHHRVRSFQEEFIEF